MNFFKKHPFLIVVLIYITISVIIYIFLGDDAGNGIDPVSEDSYLIDWGCEPGRC